METATIALVFSGLSLTISAVMAWHSIQAMKDKKQEDQLADEALWSFRVTDRDTRPAILSEAHETIREAVVTYRGSRPIKINLMEPLFARGRLLPAIHFAQVSENVSGLIPGMRTGSGCLLCGDLVMRDAARAGAGQDFWFFLEVPTRPPDDRSYSASFEVLVTFEEEVASRRLRQIKLKSDSTAWATDIAANAT